jgi:hypothetical protein
MYFTLRFAWMVLAALAFAAPSRAFVGYGIESGTALHECLARGYTPEQCGHQPERGLP